MTIVVAVLMMSCHVSIDLKSLNEAAHPSSIATAMAKAHGFPAAIDARCAKRWKSSRTLTSLCFFAFVAPDWFAMKLIIGWANRDGPDEEAGAA